MLWVAPEYSENDISEAGTVEISERNSPAEHPLNVFPQDLRNVSSQLL